VFESTGSPSRVTTTSTSSQAPGAPVKAHATAHSRPLTQVKSVPTERTVSDEAVGARVGAGDGRGDGAGVGAHV